MASVLSEWCSGARMPGAAGRAQHHRAGQSSLSTIAQPRGMIYKLIDARIDEAHELDLTHRLEALCRHADAQAADQQLGQRRIDHPLGPEPLLQPDRGAEDAAVDAHILAEHDDVGVLLHGACERQVDGFDQSHLSHGKHLSAHRAGRCRRPGACA